jgi:hypothetical protein
MKTTPQHPIEQHKRPTISIRQPNKCYIPMFKYSGSDWCFSLPVRSIYLMTIQEAYKSIQRQQQDPNTRHLDCEFKIAEIIN